MGNSQGFLNAVPSLSKKVYIITGASSGIGVETAREISKRGGKVIFGVRDVGKGKEVAEQLKKEEEVDLDIEVLELKLNSLKSIQEFAKQFLALDYPLNCLVNNAGLMMVPFRLTEDGIEEQFGVNHVGHFYLTRLLKEKLIETAQNEEEVRVVNVASSAHNWAYKGGVVFDKINDENFYSPRSAYGQSKLSNILFTKKLQEIFEEEKHSNIYCISLHPGVINTALTRDLGDTFGVSGSVTKTLWPYFTKSASTGALNNIYAAVSPEIIEKNIKGSFLNPVGKLNSGSSDAQNSELKDQLFTFTEELLAEKLGEEYVNFRE